MFNVMAFIRKSINGISHAERDARYVLMLILWLPVLVITTVQAFNKGWFDGFERPIFRAVNGFPHFLHWPFLLITQFGSLGSIIFWIPLAIFLVNRRAAAVVGGSGLAGWLAAKILKTAVHRGRPADLLQSISSYHTHFSGYGFPSGHATFSAACATALYYQISPKYRRYLIWLVLAVGISRMYLGAHFPLDVVGGWSLGIIMGSLVSIIFGNSRGSVRASFIRKILKKRNYELEKVKFLQLDARGSRPLYIKDKKGNEYFAKLFGSQEHAADWLFKTYRLFRYKNLQAEEPYFNSRRNLEVESLANLLARKAGVRVPNIIDLVKAGRYWLLIQEKIDAKELQDLKRVQTKSLIDAWRQVKKLHNIPMAHRDLRAANVMVDKQGRAWIIDFGFAENSPNKRRLLMDNAELMMSLALAVGVQRTIAAAAKVLDESELKSTLPYLQKSVFSGATRQSLRQNSSLLTELIEELKLEIGYKGEVDEANIDRFNTSKLVNLVLIAGFLYLVLPQFKQFRAAFGSLNNLRYFWLVIVAGLSFLTYISAGLVYVALSDVPLKIKDAALVQLGASFMTKILPGGLGGTALTARYLVKAGMEKAEATSLILAQALIGFIMFGLPLVLFLIFSGHSLRGDIHFHIKPKVVLGISALLLLVLILVFTVRKLRLKIINFVADSVNNLKDLSSSPKEIALAAAASLSITFFYVACLYASAHAIHINLSFGDAVFAYALAVIAKSAVPTPGGLGPLEIAMAAGLVASGLDHGQAIATVIVYRLATFWAPIPFSLLAYRYSQAKKII